jgi:flagellar biosynthesis regulator FlaF
MNIDEKLLYAKQSIQSISRHDDAPISEVETALISLAYFIGAEISTMKRRRRKSLRSKLSQLRKAIVGDYHE